MASQEVVVVAFEHWRGKYLPLSEKMPMASVNGTERMGVENLA